MTPGAGPIFARGQNSNKLCIGPVGDATYQLSRLNASYFPYVNICKICDPRGGPIFAGGGGVGGGVKIRLNYVEVQ